MKLTDLTQEQAQMLLDCAPPSCDVIVVPCENWSAMDDKREFSFCISEPTQPEGMSYCEDINTSPIIAHGKYKVLCTIAELDAYVANNAGAVREEKPELFPLDIELTKAGWEVVTRSGDTVRILCYDRIAKGGVEIVALCNIGDHEGTHAHCEDVKYRTDDESHPYDLFIKPMQRESCVNIWRGSDLPFVQYNSIDEAAAAAQDEIDASPELLDEYIGPKQITWTE